VRSWDLPIVCGAAADEPPLLHPEIARVYRTKVRGLPRFSGSQKIVFEALRNALSFGAPYAERLGQYTRVVNEAKNRH
jgi:hypothetical protein